MRRTWVVIAVIVLALGIAATASAADVTAGKAVYDRLCAMCHGAGGAGGSGPALNTARVAQAFDTSAKLRTIVRKGAPGMPEFSADLIKDTEVDDLWAYMASLWPGGSPVAGTAPTKAAAATAAPAVVGLTPVPVAPAVVAPTALPVAPVPAPVPVAPAAPVLPLEQLYALAMLAVVVVTAAAMVLLWLLVNRKPIA